VGVGVGNGAGFVEGALGVDGLDEGRGDDVDGCGVGDGGGGIVDVGVGLADGDCDVDEDGDPEPLVDGFGVSVGEVLGAPETVPEGDVDELGLGVTSARAGTASARQMAADSAAAAVRRTTS